jgi:hypothetical protein
VSPATQIAITVSVVQLDATTMEPPPPAAQVPPQVPPPHAPLQRPPPPPSARPRPPLPGGAVSKLFVGLGGAFIVAFVYARATGAVNVEPRPRGGAGVVDYNEAKRREGSHGR